MSEPAESVFIGTSPVSFDVTLDASATQGQRERFAQMLRDAADLISSRELRQAERISLAHVEFVVEPA